MKNKRFCFGMMAVLVIVLTFGMTVVACGDGSGDDSGGGGGGGNVVPSDIHGKWTSGAYTHTITGSTLLSEYASSSVPDNWWKVTYDVTNCTKEVNTAAATRDVYSEGYRLSLRLTKKEIGPGYTSDNFGEIGSTSTQTAYHNAAKNRMILNGSDNFVYAKN